MQRAPRSNPRIRGRWETAQRFSIVLMAFCLVFSAFEILHPVADLLKGTCSCEPWASCDSDPSDSGSSEAHRSAHSNDAHDPFLASSASRPAQAVTTRPWIPAEDPIPDSPLLEGSSPVPIVRG